MTEFPSTKRVGILVFDGFEPIDVYGPIEAFAISRFIGTGYYSKPPHPFDIKLITNQTQPTGGGTPTPVRSYYNGPKVLPDLFRDQALGFGIDVLLIPGGAGVRNLLNGSKDEVDTLLEWVNDMNEEVELMTSVCTGSAVLAKSGILDGKRATTNHEAFAWVTQFGGKVKWDNVARWVHDDHYVTSAGVSAGTDMAFYLVSLLFGRAVAEKAASSAEYHWHRDPEVPIPYPQQAVVPTRYKEDNKGKE